MTITSSGRNYAIKNVSLTDAYQDIQVTRACTAFSLQVRGDAKVLWRRDAVYETDEWTLKEGHIYSVDGSCGSQDGATITIGQSKCANTGATDILEIWCWYGA